MGRRLYGRWLYGYDTVGLWPRERRDNGVAGKPPRWHEETHNIQRVIVTHMQARMANKEILEV